MFAPVSDTIAAAPEKGARVRSSFSNAVACATENLGAELDDARTVTPMPGSAFIVATESASKFADVS